jgi:hypothetical protein
VQSHGQDEFEGADRIQIGQAYQNLDPNASESRL